MTSRQIKGDHIQEPLLQSLPVDASTSEQSDEQSPASIKAVAAEEAQVVIPQEEQLDRLYQEALYQEQENAYQEFDSKLLQVKIRTLHTFARFISIKFIEILLIIRLI